MTTRQISIIAGIGIFIGAFFLMKVLSNQEKPPEKNYGKSLTQYVKTQTISNAAINNSVTAYGRVAAKNKIEVYAEVQGNLKANGKRFKEGVHFKKGEVMLAVEGGDAYMNLLAQRSAFLNSLTALIPDIRIDYPENSAAWQKYLEQYDINRSIPALPDTKSDKEKYFVAAHNIYNQYYNIKNLEIKVGKYVITAPYNGVVTQSFVNPGMLIRPGMKLGEYIGDNVFEMEATINADLISLINVGDEAAITTKGEGQSWKGKVTRINKTIDPTTQTIKVYIETSGEALKDGMYLTAKIDAGKIENATVIERNHLINDTYVYAIEKGQLTKLPVEIIRFDGESVIVKGLENGTVIVAQQVKGAFEGMKVKDIDEEEEAPDQESEKKEKKD